MSFLSCNSGCGAPVFQKSTDGPKLGEDAIGVAGGYQLRGVIHRLADTGIIGVQDKHGEYITK